MRERSEDEIRFKAIRIYEETGRFGYAVHEADVRGGEAPARPSLHRGRPDGGRGAGRVFFMTGDFEMNGKSIVFRAIFRSTATMIRPDGLLRGHLSAGLPPKFRVKIG